MRLYTQIFLLVTLSALAAAGSMAALTSLSLSRGFEAFLLDRDAQRLSEFVAEAESLIASNPDAGMQSVVAMIPDRRPDGAPQQGSRMRPGAPPRGEAGNVPPPRPQEPTARAGRQLPPPGFMPRLSIYDIDGERLAGPPLRSDSSGAVRRPITYQGQMVGEVVLLSLGPSPEGIETDFIRDQLGGIVILLAVILALAGFAAFLIARRGSAVLAVIENVASSVADGDFSVRAEIRGKGEIATLAGNINRMAEKLGTLQQARRTWLAEVGHELRTPLTVLQGELEALQDGIRPLDMTAINSLREEADQLSLLVDDLQFLAVSDIARPRFQYQPLEIATLLETARRRFEPQCRDQGLELSFEDMVPASANPAWDEARIGQLIANLISNAGKYTDAPGRIVVAAFLQAESVRLVVEDSPPGVESDDLGKLFEPLFRGEKSRARRHGGSGLGLAVCAIIAEEHGGSISAQPSGMGGLKVVVDLPLQPPRAMSNEPDD